MSSVYHRVKRLFLWIFIVMLSVSFIAYFGISEDYLGGHGGTGGYQNSLEVGSVDGAKIENGRYDDFTLVYQQLASSYQRQGADLQNEQLRAQLAQAAFYQTAVGLLATKENEKNSLFLSDEQVVSYIKERYFDNEVENFNNFMASRDINAKRAVEKTGRRQANRLLIEETFWNYVPTSGIMLGLLTEVGRKEKSALVGYVLFEEQLEQSITEAVLRQYFQDNKARYATSFATTNEAALNLGSEEEREAALYENLAEQIRSDYLLQNSQQLRSEFENRLNFELQALITKAQAEPVSRAVFAATVEKLGMKTAATDFLQLFSQRFFPPPRATGELSAFSPFVLPPPEPPSALLEKIMTAEVGTVSEVVQDQRGAFIAYVLDERENPTPPSAFLRRQYERSLLQNKQRRIAASYFSQLYEGAEIFFLGQEQ